MTGPDRERLSPCVCSTLRMVSRAVTQLYDDILRPSGLRVTQFSILGAIARLSEANLRQLEHTLAIDQTTLTRSLKLLERDGAIERVPHPDGRIKAMTLTSKGRRALEAARPLWARAQGKVLRGWVRPRGRTRSGGWPTCFESPSRSAGGLGARAVSGPGAHEEEASDVDREKDARACALWVDRRGGDVRDPPGRRGIRSAPGVLIIPLEREFGWTRATVFVRCLHQPVPLWSVRAVHRWTDGPTRHPARHGDVTRGSREGGRGSGSERGQWIARRLRLGYRC